MLVRLERVYQEPESGGGHRVLVDRYRPRCLRKDEDWSAEWLKEYLMSAVS